MLWCSVILLFFNVLVVNGGEQSVNEIDTLLAMRSLSEDSPSIMFWRPQKVGSSTLLGILVSYAYRYNALPRRRGTKSGFCSYMRSSECYVNPLSIDSTGVHAQYNRLSKGIQSKEERNNVMDIIASKIPFRMSVSHEICSASFQKIASNLPCGFKRELEDIKQLFLVRNPLDRLISAYYFWGELAVLSAAKKKRFAKLVNSIPSSKHSKSRMGNSVDVSNPDKTLVKGPFFDYHGDESTVPPEDIAIAYAQRLPLTATTKRGSPSYTWALFGNNLNNTVSAMQDGEHRNQIMSLVTERLDESLVVMMHYLNNGFNNMGVREGRGRTTKTYWTLADIVYVTNRKAQSPHPKHHEWPPSAITLINDTLIKKGEYVVYDTANQMLDMRINYLTQHKAVAFQEEVKLFKTLKKRVSEICLTEDYLKRYQKLLKTQLPFHDSKNKLRDAPNEVFAEGHDFSLNRELLFSYDVCGACEAHSILIYMENQRDEENIASNMKEIENRVGFLDLSESWKNDTRLEKCKLFYEQ